MRYEGGRLTGAGKRTPDETFLSFQKIQSPDNVAVQAFSSFQMRQVAVDLFFKVGRKAIKNSLCLGIIFQCIGKGFRSNHLRNGGIESDRYLYTFPDAAGGICQHFGIDVQAPDTSEPDKRLGIRQSVYCSENGNRPLVFTCPLKNCLQNSVRNLYKRIDPDNLQDCRERKNLCAGGFVFL